jgi:lipopolysaccharide export system protein LptA
MKNARPWLLAGLLLAPQLAHAQSLSFSSKDPDKPITVTAEQGLEWQQNAQQFIAHGNAKAVQGDVTVVADELIAHYRSKPKGKAASTDASSDDLSSEVYRVDAAGKVTITSNGETATGAAAVYDFDRKVLVMQGDLVTLTTNDAVVTAHKAIQYWSEENVAVAQGDALAVDSDASLGRRIKADTLTAFFRDAPDAKPPAKTTNAKAPAAKKSADPLPSAKGRDLIYMQGQGNVVLTTKTEIVHGDHANYNLDTGMATVDGNVKMTRENNQLNGGYAVVNVKGGRSIVYTNAAQAKGAGAGPAPVRVSALLSPNTDPNAPAQPVLSPSQAPPSKKKKR